MYTSYKFGHLRGGNPKSSGLTSSKECSRNVAILHKLSSVCSSGTMTTCIPAPRAACTPFGASSNTKHSSGFGQSLNREAQTKNMSGLGLPRFTSGSLPPVTTWLNMEKSAACLATFRSYVSCPDDVATAMGICFEWKCLTSRSAPATGHRCDSVVLAGLVSELN
jgi:hypothetical protein